MPKPLTQTQIKAFVEGQFPGTWAILTPPQRTELAGMLNEYRAKRLRAEAALGKMFAAMRRKR
jgi:hypothetical protein